MLEECGETRSCVLGVTDVDFMAAVVFPRVADIETACGVWCPSLSLVWCDVCFNFASKWCKRIPIVSCSPQRYAYADTDGVIFEVQSMLSVCSACPRSLSHK